MDSENQSPAWHRVANVCMPDGRHEQRVRFGIRRCPLLGNGLWVRHPACGHWPLRGMRADTGQ